MSSDATNPRANSQFEPLSFDGAAAPASATCTKCGAALRGSYHMIGDSVACAKCRYAAQASPGEGASTTQRAVAFGFGAVVAAAIVNYAIGKATGSDFPVFVILAAYAAGQAVRVGSRRVGSRKIQTIAIIMAYLAMGAGYVPLVLSVGAAVQKQTRAAGIARAQATIDSINAASPDAADDSEAGAALAAAQTRLQKAKNFSVPTSGAVEAVVIGVVGAPILMSLNPIYGFFIAFALYRAWKRNAGEGSGAEPVAVSGPFRLQPGGSAAR
jgi:hypothetical protein